MATLERVVFGKTVPGMMVFALLAAISLGASAAWEPEKPIDLIVPAEIGSRTDQTARLLQSVVVKYKLMKQPLTVVNQSGDYGSEGFLSIKSTNPYKIILSHSNILLNPITTGAPFNWRQFTPVSMLALDQFILWTDAGKQYRSPMAYIEATKAAGPSKMKMGGTGSKKDAQFLTVAIEKQTAVKFAYIPLKNNPSAEGVDIDSLVTTPAEGAARWRAGVLTPQCVAGGERLPYRTKVAGNVSWHDIPTCKEAGLPVEYQGLLGIFMAPGVTAEQVGYFVEIIRKVMATSEWKDYVEKSAIIQSAMTGTELSDWLGNADQLNKTLLDACRFGMPSSR